MYISDLLYINTYRSSSAFTAFYAKPSLACLKRDDIIAQPEPQMFAKEGKIALWYRENTYESLKH